MSILLHEWNYPGPVASYGPGALAGDGGANLHSCSQQEAADLFRVEGWPRNQRWSAGGGGRPTWVRISGRPGVRIHARTSRAGPQYLFLRTSARWTAGGERGDSQLWLQWQATGHTRRQAGAVTGFPSSLFLRRCPLWTWSSLYWPCGSAGVALLNVGRVGRIRESGDFQPAGGRRADAVEIAREHHPEDGMMRDGK